MTELQWKGYAVHDTLKWTEFKVIDFTPKTFGEEDVDVKIDYCGVCGSDLHTITGGWGQPMLPVIPCHEIVGKVVRVGSKVTEFKPGDRVGVGPQVWSCNKCANCRNDNGNYCRHLVHTYNSKYPNGDLAYGGYSTAIRVSERYVFAIPEKLSLEQAAPMLCAGLSVFSPLVRNGAGPGKKVGVVGVGGLGHYAIQFAKALGAEADAVEMGADEFVITREPNALVNMEMTLDLIICTADVSHGIPLTKLLQTLTVHGKFVMVALPDEALPDLYGTSFISNGCSLSGSQIGSKKEAIQMLNIAVEKGVKSWIDVRPMSEVGECVKRVKENKVKYRHVLKADF
ncbi:NADPH-dependent alcohol dehydrogenase [Armillaria luteobubalina]|uniref:NADPH-dependent alcohol dehydrogenase n=1 Tax=Armillaria luteobubalina TaxID=153913 RepID=A0AA39PS24_9AGAR|nr:NADPH-dependent alcohol dehydrogenase [Armillaria luteobubalina]